MTCKDEADLHEEYARVIRMCKGTKVGQQYCWKYNGEVIGREPFFCWLPARYSFAIAIVEDRPVFEGDVLYDNLGAPHAIKFHNYAGDAALFIKENYALEIFWKCM